MSEHCNRVCDGQDKLDPTPQSSQSPAPDEESHSSSDSEGKTVELTCPAYSSSFPWKLHKMLEDAENANQTSIVSWTSNGRAFHVHERLAFMESIIPKYFKHTKFKSFQRQLYLYDFKRVPSGGNKGNVPAQKSSLGVREFQLENLLPVVCQLFDLQVHIIIATSSGRIDPCASIFLDRRRVKI